MDIQYNFLKNKQYVINSEFIKVCNNLKLNLNEFLLLIYFHNEDLPLLEIDKIEDNLSINKNDILDSFNNLLSKDLISIDTKKDKDNKLIEIISLDNFYQNIFKQIKNNNSKVKEEDIYQIFENELGRTISPMEYEIINGWIQTDISKDLIIGALKEAVYNGVNNFRYIDKIIYEWNKKGFKSMEDVNNHLEKKEDKNYEDLFDYDWLNDEE